VSLPTLTFRTATLCTDARCTATRTCWRAEHEDFGNAPGENYGPRCIPAPAFDLAAVRLTALLEAERENTTLRELLDAKSHEAGLYARRMEQAQRSRDEAIREERAAVVAYLRTTQPTRMWAALLDAADDIECGEHRRKETK
jgi:hypothetical protein